MDEMFAAAGAVVVGRRMYDVVDGKRLFEHLGATFLGSSSCASASRRTRRTSATG